MGPRTGNRRSVGERYIIICIFIIIINSSSSSGPHHHSSPFRFTPRYQEREIYIYLEREPGRCSNNECPSERCVIMVISTNASPSSMSGILLRVCLPPTLPRPVQFRYIVATSDVLLLSTKVPRVKSVAHSATPQCRTINYLTGLLPPKPLTCRRACGPSPRPSRHSTGSSLYCLRTTAYLLPDLT